ncbi:MAG: ABC transporter ATP-binding protein [Acidimicrobiales bacterium]
MTMMGSGTGPGWGGSHMGGGAGPVSGDGRWGGIPDELFGSVSDIEALEPEVRDDAPVFDYAALPGEKFTLRSLLAARKIQVAVALLLVAIATASLQVAPYLTKIAIDGGIMHKNVGILVTVSLVFLGSVIVTVVAQSLQTAFTGRLTQSILYDIRLRVFAHVQRMSLGYFTSERTGRIMTRMTSDVEQVGQLLQNGLLTMVIQAMNIVLVVAVLVAINAELAAYAILIVLPVMTLLTLWFRKYSETGFKRVRDGIADVLADLAESLAGHHVADAFNRHPRNIENHEKVVGRYRDANIYTARLQAIYQPGTVSLGMAAQATLLLIGGEMLFHHQISVGGLVAFILYLSTFFGPIQQMVQLYNTYQAGQAAMHKLGGLLATEPDMVEYPKSRELAVRNGEIDIEDVSFGYIPGQEVVHGLSLHVGSHERLCLVGSTGAGKSTIVKLLNRFYDPGQGRVCIDGQDISRVTLKSLRRQVLLVTQEPFIFETTLRENLTFGAPSCSEDDMLEALEMTGLYGMVSGLPDGLESLCSERGVTFSAGERQLIALARAFLAQPRILLADEATSNLDMATERRIERALDTILEGRSSVVVAHRLSTALRSDKIAVIEDGRVIETGSHEELVAAGGRYAQMYSTWMKPREASAVS